MKGVSTNRQLFMMLLLSIAGVSLITLPGDAVKASDTGAWLTLLLLTAVFALGIFVIASLSHMFEGKTIFEYASLLVGKAAAIIIGLIYSAYFVFAVTLVYRSVASLLKENYFPLTPIWALLLALAIVCFYIASKGVTNVGRMCEIFGTIFIIVTLAIHITMICIGDIQQIKPFIDPDQIKEYVWGMKDLVIPFLGLEILTIIPFGKANRKRGVFYCVLAMAYIGFFYIITTESTIMIVGIDDVKNHTASLIEGLRETVLPSTILLERADTLFISVGFSGLVCCLSVLTFAAIEHLSKVFMKKKKGVLLRYAFVIVFFASSFLLNDTITKFLLKSVLPYFGIVVAFVIPMGLFAIAKIKKTAFKALDT